MTTALLPELAGDLATAAERLAATPAPVRRRRRLRLAALGSVAVLAASGVATAATSLWHPQVGDGSKPSSIAHDAPPQDQLDALGVLRRAQTDADRGQNSEYTLKFFGDLRGVRLDYVRLLGTQTGGAGYVLVSAASEGTDGLVAKLRALKATKAGRVAREPLKDPLCLFARDPVNGGGMNCFTLQQILDGRAVMGMSPEHGPLTQFGLVPDSVASVRVGSAADAPVVDVHDNFFDVTTPVEDAASTSAGMTLHFLDADGSEIMRGPVG
jgi:hypothetical protein